MLEEERFKKRIISLKDAAYQGKLVLLPFLDTTNQEIIRNSFKKNEEIKPYFYGGYLDSEYKRCIFYSEEISLDYFQIAKLKINYSKLNGNLNHSMILGSVLGLGLKREIVGDIILYNDAYYLLVDNKMTDFIIDNLNYIGRVPVKLQEVFYDLSNQNKYLNKTCFLASMRLDVVIAGFYGISRKDTLEMIKAGFVKLNHQEILNPSQMLKENDVLSIRKKGRVIIEKIGGKTKSGNLIVELKKPID